MKVTERIKEIWLQIEKMDSAESGLYKLRYSDTSKCDVFLGLKFPEAHRMLIIKAPLAIGRAFKFKYDFKGLTFDKIYDPDSLQHLLLNLILVDDNFKDVFDALIADVLSAILNEARIAVILKNYSNRLIKWQRLFERFKPQGLTTEEQKGLFGELFLLRKLLQGAYGSTSVVTSWVGSEKHIRDFQFNNWSIEVKTTQANNHQRLHISSERQLDCSKMPFLFLYHLSLEERIRSGETLNDIVCSVKELLQTDLVALTNFDAKLLMSGYLDNHIALYNEKGYVIRQETFYRVQDEFPRIEEQDIRSGVGDVEYSIVVSQASEYVQAEQEVFKTLDFNE
jgi:hypothetical protein